MLLTSRTRRTGLIGAIASAVVLPMLALPAAQAAEATATVSFTDCEVHKFPYTTNQQIGGETSWTTSLRLKHPSPVAAREEITVEAELGALPANTMPESMTDLRVQVYYLEVVNSFAPGSPILLYSDNWIGSWDHTTPLVLPEIEQEETYYEAGHYDHRVRKIFLLFTGRDAGDNFVEYSYSCDNVVNPQPILTTSAFDPAAAATLSLAPAEQQVGGQVAFTGTHFLSGTPAGTETAHVTVGGLSVGSFPVDASGAIQGSFTVPAGMSGPVTVQATHGSKSAAAVLNAMSTGPGGSGQIDIDNPATWHPNAQNGTVDGQATIKVARKKIKRNKKVKLGGARFAPREAVILRFKRVRGKSKGRKRFSQVVYANSAGAIKSKLTLKKAAQGSWRVTGIGIASGHGAKASFKVR